MNPIRNYKELERYFEHMDYSEVKTIEGCTGLRPFIARMLSYYPWWIRWLYRIRELLVNILGLVKHKKPGNSGSIKPETISFQPGERASIFIVHTAKEDSYWISETPEDKHLKAYFGVVAEELENNVTRFHVFTSIQYRHWTGPVYFNLIRPFHHLVVSRMMKAGIGY